MSMFLGYVKVWRCMSRPLGLQVHSMFLHNVAQMTVRFLKKRRLMADCGLVTGIRGKQHAEGPLRQVEPTVTYICKGLKQQRV